MPVPVDILEDIENDPEFAELDYEDQLGVRAQILAERLPQQDGWDALHPKDKERIFDALLVRPPIFKAGPGNTQRTRPDRPTRQEAADLWEQLALSGEISKPEHARALQAAVGFSQAADSVVMAKLVYKAFEPVGRGIAAGADLLAEGISRATGLPVREGSDLTDRFHTERAFQRDDRKLNAYLSLLGEQGSDERLQRKLNLVSGITTTSGLMLDLALGYGLSQVIPAVGGARTVSALTRTGQTATLRNQVLQRIKDIEQVAGRTRLSRFALGRVAPATARATGTAIFGTAREVAQDLMTKGNLGPRFSDGTLRAAKHFGSYFIGDMIVFGAIGSLKALAGGAKQVFGRAITGDKPLTFMRDVMEHAVEGRAVPDELIAQIPNEHAREYVRNLPRAFRNMGRVESAVPGSQAYLDAAGVISHMSVRKTARGFRLRDLDTGKVTTTKSYDKAMSIMADRIKARGIFDESVLEALAVSLGRRSAPRTRMSRTVTSRSSLPVSNVEAIVRGLNPPSGIPTPVTVKNIAAAFLREAGGTGEEAVRLAVRTVDDYFTQAARTRRAASRVIEIPKSINNSAEAIEFQRRTLERLGGFSARVLPSRAGREVAKEILEGLPEEVVKRRAFGPAWTQFAAAKQLNAIAEPVPGGSGAWQLRTQEGVLQTFDDFEGLESFMFARNINAPIAREYILREFNATLARGKDGLWRVKDRATGSVLEQGAGSLDELFSRHPDWRPKLPHHVLPDVHLLDDNVLEVVHRQGIMEGDLGALRRHLDNFRDYGRSAFMSELPGPRDSKVRLDRRSQVYEVEIPDIGYRTTFDELKPAREFARGAWKEWDNLTQIADSKHMSIVPLGDGMLVYERGKESVATVARTFDDVHAAMRKVPTPEAAPELSGYSEDLIQSATHPNGERIKVIDEVYEADFQNFRPKDDTTAIQDLSTFWRPKEGVIRGMAARTGQAGVEAQFGNIQVAQRTMTALDGGIRSDLIRLAKDAGGGKLPPARRVREFTHAWRSGDTVAEWNAWLDKNGMKLLNDDEVKALERLDSTMAAFREAEGIDLRDYLRRHLPEVRNQYQANPSAFLKHISAREMFEAVGKSGTPDGQDVWSIYERLEDVVALSRKDNVFEQGMLAVHGINRRNVLRPILDDAISFLNDNASTIPKALREEMALYIRDVTGLPTSIWEARLRDTTMKFGSELVTQFEKWGWLKGVSRAERIMVGDSLQALLSFSTTATMGFRVFLPIRNMFQVFTMLGSRVGINPVFKAMGRVAREGDQIIEKMRRAGIIQNLETFGMGFEGIRRNVTNVSLSAYRNSDTWTRAVAYVVAEDMMEAALRQQRAGVLRSTDEFINLSGLDIMDRQLRDRALRLIDSGQERAAVDLLGHQLVNETMFAYQRAMSPRAFRGVVGKLFGQYGTYPVWYVENVLRGVSRGSLARRAAFVTRWMASGLAIYGGFRAVFGIDARQFLPWQPMMFTGGPYYTMMTRLLNATGQHPEAKMNRRAILRELPRITVPGHAVIRNLQGVAEALDRGDYYEAVLLATTAPYRPEITRIVDPEFSITRFFDELGQ